MYVFLNFLMKYENVNIDDVLTKLTRKKQYKKKFILNK